MILILTKNKNLAQELSAELTKLLARTLVIEPSDTALLDKVYNSEATALIVDAEFANLPRSVTIDILNSLSERIPVLVTRTSEAGSLQASRKRLHGEFDHTVTVLEKPTTENIIATLQACGALGDKTRQSWSVAVPYYNHAVPAKMLVENGGIGVLTIDASGFRKIEIEYGTKVFNRVREVFQKILNELWGRPGSFRSTDVLCRRSDYGNLYFVFLNRSRSTGNLPLPGIIESIADRLGRTIQNVLWQEVLATREERRLPDCVTSMPMIVVGYASAVYNPCLDPVEVIESLIETSTDSTRVQYVRVKDRHRELMHTLIQSDNLLYPNYQAVFRLPNLTKDLLEQSRAAHSIKPLEGFLFGFESLVRVKVGDVKALVGSSRAIIEPKYLRPDVLFDIAKYTKVALELDQACLKLAVTYADKLPGALMINILPRNLYFVEYLSKIFQGKSNIVLEVSESEAINNFALVREVQELLAKNNIRLAADDFGRGFAGLDRVMDIKPHIIKFDRSLIVDVHLDPVKRSYLSGLVSAARLLNSLVLAEGVEKWEEAQVLQEMGIDLIQGYLLHRPEAVELIFSQLMEEAAQVQKPAA